MTPRLFFKILELIPWLVFFLYWAWMWNKAKPKASGHSDPWSNFNRVLLVITAVLLASHRLDIGWLGQVLIPRCLAKALTGLAVTSAGVAYAIWARNTLADNWSAQPTLKEGHELVVSGPYRYTRHPIYTGILIALLGTAIMVGEVRGFIALAIAFIAFWHKSRFEEDLMNQQFPEQYKEYSQGVKKLIPWVF